MPATISSFVDDALVQIMKGAAFVVDEIQRGVAVLVHCSDGWDRTSQLTALAQASL